jgi:hypothetical protein
MKGIPAALFWWLALAANSFGLDIITKDGKAFFDCKVSSVESDGVRITHRDGVALLDFDTLPFSIQRQYGWTEQKSAERKAARAEAMEKQKVGEAEALKMRRTAATEMSQAGAPVMRQEEVPAGKNVGIALVVTFLYFLPSFLIRKAPDFRVILAMNVLGWIGMALGSAQWLPLPILATLSVPQPNIFLGFGVAAWVVGMLWASAKD